VRDSRFVRLRATRYGVTGCLLLASGFWLPASGCWLLAAGCWLLAAGREQKLATGNWQLATGNWKPASSPQLRSRISLSNRRHEVFVKGTVEVVAWREAPITSGCRVVHV
jgi:hypothetical protein